MPMALIRARSRKVALALLCALLVTSHAPLAQVTQRAACTVLRKAIEDAKTIAPQTDGRIRRLDRPAEAKPCATPAPTPTPAAAAAAPGRLSHA